MSFQDIKGQNKPIQILKEYLKQSHLTGSYLFTGEEGIGKKLIAKTVAKALNCHQQTWDSCDTCASCVKIEKEQHPDVHYVNVEDTDSIKIESIRQLQKDISLKPYEEKKKVFIIDEAHNLTADASNALLKILEEPGQDSLIILISAKPSLLFKTIISRCKTLRFFPLKRSELEEILKQAHSLDTELAHFLAYFCEGRLGKALKLKNTDILKEKNRVIDGIALSEKSGSEVLAIENRDNLRRYLNILAGWFRDMYFVKVGISYSELINLDRRDDLLRFMNRYTLFDLEEALNSLSNSLFYLEQNINRKLLLSNLREDINYGASRPVKTRPDLTTH